MGMESDFSLGFCHFFLSLRGSWPARLTSLRWPWIWKVVKKQRAQEGFHSLQLPLKEDKKYFLCLFLFHSFWLLVFSELV